MNELSLDSGSSKAGSAGKVSSAQEFPSTLGAWLNLLHGEGRRELEEVILPTFLPGCRWFGGKSKILRSTRVADAIPVSKEAAAGRLVLVDVDYEQGPRETYLLPLQIAGTQGESARTLEGTPAILAHLQEPEGNFVLFDGIYDPRFRAALLGFVALGEEARGMNGGTLRGVSGSTFDSLTEGRGRANPLESRVIKVEQSNSSIAYEERLFLKLYRKLEPGINPDAELIRFLSENQRFPKVPPFGGALEYHCSLADSSSLSSRSSEEVRVLGLFLGSVPNEGDAWALALRSLGRFFGQISGRRRPVASGGPRRLGRLLFGKAARRRFRYAAVYPAPLFGPYNPSPSLEDLIGEAFPQRVRQLARATGELHLALAAAKQDPDFNPEPITPAYQEALCQGEIAFTRAVLQRLSQKLPELQTSGLGNSCLARQLAQRVLALEDALIQRPRQLLQREIKATLTRTHGDYHLGQVLDTGSDFVIIDFEGEPSRPLAERKLKRSPLRDVAGMIRSFHYAPHAALAGNGTARAEPLGGSPIHRDPSQTAEDRGAVLEQWGDLWARHVSRFFLDSYLERVAGASFLPDQPADLQLLLETFLLEKAVYEVYYELNNRPDWLPIPLRGLLEIAAKE